MARGSTLQTSIGCFMLRTDDGRNVSKKVQTAEVSSHDQSVLTRSTVAWLLAWRHGDKAVPQVL